MRTVGIVGAGASGTLVAVNLLRRGDVRVVLVERRGDFGPGVAYSTRDDRHLLNVPMERMSGLADAPGHFAAYARRRARVLEAGAFAPRRVYGDYLRALLCEAADDRLETVTGEVVDVGPDATLALADGRAIRCDAAVLALGSPPAPLPAGARGAWGAGALDPHPGATLLIGTGLTAIDAALSLAEGGPVVAVSRSGRLPHAHLPGLRAPAPAPAVPAFPCSWAQLGEQLRAHLAAQRAAGYDWRDVLDGLRPVTDDLWRALPLSERARWLARHGRDWDVHRHRMAPPAARRLREALDGGRLRVLGGGADAVAGRFDRVLACTGAAPHVAASADPLLRRLLRHGRAAAHPLGLGLRTARDGALLDAAGRPSARLFTLGPLRRGELWETTAIPEIRVQADALARRLLQDPPTGMPPRRDQMSLHSAHTSSGTIPARMSSPKILQPRQ
jgi:uncharacterized NAD(P)/FAD-binding protein YdhS